MQRSASGRFSGLSYWPLPCSAPDAPALRCRASGGERRHAAVGRVDDERAAVFAVDDRHAIAGVDPEVVVAADVAGRAGRAVAALGRGRAVRIARLGQPLDAVRHALLDPGDHVRRERRLAPCGRSSGVIVRVGPVALQVRTAVRRARHGPRFRWPAGRLRGGRRRSRRRCAGAARRRRQAPTASTTMRSPYRRSIGVRGPTGRVLAQVAVHQLFDELDALELAEPRVGVHVPIQRHAHRPRPRERLRIRRSSPRTGCDRARSSCSAR